MLISVFRVFVIPCVLSAAWLTVACTEASAPGAEPPPSTATPAAAPAAPAEPQTVADIFPPGAQREAVMNSCGSCHNLACAAIGQRSAERWDALRDGHKDTVSSGDLAAMFEYLKTNFNASRPEPKIPPRFLEGGCTPF
jgi:hypothetical protein